MTLNCYRHVISVAFALGAATLSVEPAHSQELATRTAMVDGSIMRVATVGFDDRTQYQPAIILESGAGNAIESWNPMFSKLTEIAPVIAYDRPGLGQSESSEQPSTPDSVTARLRSMLAVLDVAPPYVLVGHSLGGLLVHHFAAQHPEEVVGIVYIDPVNLAVDLEGELEFMGSLGISEVEYFQMIDEERRRIAEMPPGLRDDLEMLADFQAGLHRDSAVISDIPVAVLLSGMRPPSPPHVEISADYRRGLEATIRRRVQIFADWVLTRPQGMLLLATHAGHDMQADDPQLVAEAIGAIIRLGLVEPEVERSLRTAPR